MAVSDAFPMLPLKTATARAAGHVILLLALALAMTGSATQARADETHQYDAIGRKTDIAYASGASIHYTYDANGNVLSIVSSSGITGVGGAGAPLMFSLGPVTPNPGSGPRTIAFAIPIRGHVTLRALDVTGRRVATLFDRELDPGRYAAQFSTARWSAGVYFYRLEAGGQVRTGRLTVRY